MSPRVLAAAAALALLAGLVGAEEAVPGPELARLVEVDPVALIGWTLPRALATAGAPAEVFAYRGVEAWQDDVVFYYPGSVYLFWYGNRVWQVRVDARYAGTILGLRLGDSRGRAIQLIPRPYQEVSDSLVFLLTDASLLEMPDGTAKGTYPLRLRLFFQDDRLTDVYLYRGDF